MLKPYPFTLPESQPHNVVFEGNLEAIHGSISKYPHPNERGYHKEIELPMTKDLLF
jgi:hypothetical protein